MTSAKVAFLALMAATAFFLWLETNPKNDPMRLIAAWACSVSTIAMLYCIWLVIEVAFELPT